MDAEPARGYGVNRDTLARAVAILDVERLVRAAPSACRTIVRHGMSRLRRPRGNLVKRDLAAGGPGYSFPAASGQEMWTHPSCRPSAKKLTGPGSCWPLAARQIRKMCAEPAYRPVMVENDRTQASRTMNAETAQAVTGRVH